MSFNSILYPNSPEIYTFWIYWNGFYSMKSQHFHILEFAGPHVYVCCTLLLWCLCMSLHKRLLPKNVLSHLYKRIVIVQLQPEGVKRSSISFIYTSLCSAHLPCLDILSVLHFRLLATHLYGSVLFIIVDTATGEYHLAQGAVITYHHVDYTKKYARWLQTKPLALSQIDCIIQLVSHSPKPFL